MNCQKNMTCNVFLWNVCGKAADILLQNWARENNKRDHNNDRTNNRTFNIHYHCKGIVT